MTKQGTLSPESKLLEISKREQMDLFTDTAAILDSIVSDI